MTKKKKYIIFLITGGLAFIIGTSAFSYLIYDTSKKRECARNLMYIYMAKGFVADSNKIKSQNLFTIRNAAPMTIDQLTSYNANISTKCPFGGKISIGYFGQTPMCSIHGPFQCEKMNRDAFIGNISGVRNALNNNYGTNGCNFLQALPYTPLHYAAMGGHVNIVKLLLEKGAKVNTMNGYGQTPLDLAKTPEIANTLKAHGGREVYNVYLKRPEDIDKSNKLAAVLLIHNKSGNSSHIFTFALSNLTNKNVIVKIISSMVCDIKNGNAYEAEMPASHADNWLCHEATIIDLKPNSQHFFNLKLVYDINEKSGFTINSKATGFWSGEGYSASSSSDCTIRAIGAWLLVDIKTENTQINGVPIYSKLVYY